MVNDLEVHFPVHYDPLGQQIFDSSKELIVDVRGWGRLQKMNDPEFKQDQIGEFVAAAMNEKAKRSE